MLSEREPGRLKIFCHKQDAAVVYRTRHAAVRRVSILISIEQVKTGEVQEVDPWESTGGKFLDKDVLLGNQELMPYIVGKSVTH